MNLLPPPPPPVFPQPTAGPKCYGMCRGAEAVCVCVCQCWKFFLGGGREGRRGRSVLGVRCVYRWKGFVVWQFCFANILSVKVRVNGNCPKLCCSQFDIVIVWNCYCYLVWHYIDISSYMFIFNDLKVILCYGTIDAIIVAQCTVYTGMFFKLNLT